MKIIPVNMLLNYSKKKMVDEKGEELTPPMMSRMIISSAIESNNPQMERNMATQYRELVLAMEEDMEGPNPYLMLTASQFDFVRREVDSAKFVPQLAIMSPVLYAELDRCALRSDEENQKLFERITHKAEDE